MLVERVSVVAESAEAETFLDLAQEITLVDPGGRLRNCFVPSGREVLISETFEVALGELLTSTRHLMRVLTE